MVYTFLTIATLIGIDGIYVLSFASSAKWNRLQTLLLEVFAGSGIIGLAYLLSNLFVYHQDSLARSFAGDMLVWVIVSLLFGDFLGLVFRYLGKQIGSRIGKSGFWIWLILALIPYAIFNWISLYLTIHAQILHP